MISNPHNKTPWNPSRRATARVKDPLPAPTVCPHCAGAVQIVHHDDLYGRAYGEWPWVYQCGICKAYVGMHPFTNIPLGTLAGDELRKARQQCKQPFEVLWQSKKLTRDVAYQQLATHLGLTAAECHFGLFNIDQCRRAKKWAVAILRETA